MNETYHEQKNIYSLVTQNKQGAFPIQQQQKDQTFLKLLPYTRFPEKFS